MPSSVTFHRLTSLELQSAPCTMRDLADETSDLTQSAVIPAMKIPSPLLSWRRSLTTTESVHPGGSGSFTLLGSCPALLRASRPLKDV